MKISRKLRRELMLVVFDLVDGQVDDLEAMIEILEAVAAEGRKQLEATT
ncbi:MAG: hypothetical protein AAFQ91_16545 [Cyanobacteria bacterium J06621_15]